MEMSERGDLRPVEIEGQWRLHIPSPSYFNAVIAAGAEMISPLLRTQHYERVTLQSLEYIIMKICMLRLMPGNVSYKFHEDLYALPNNRNKCLISFIMIIMRSATPCALEDEDFHASPNARNMCSVTVGLPGSFHFISQISLPYNVASAMDSESRA